MRTTKIETGAQAGQVMDNALATCQHALRCAVNHTMQTSPGNLVFRRDMFIDVPVHADLIAIRDRRQELIDKNIMRHNRKRYDYHFKVGEEVMVKTYDPTKMDERLHGPYPILETRTNGTVVVQRHPWLTETYNIRKIEPYHGSLRQQQQVLQQRLQERQQFQRYATQHHIPTTWV